WLGGTCTGGPRWCDDGVPCTDDSCVAGECRHEPLDGRCDTGECFLAQCAPGAPGADAAGCTRAPVGEGDTCTSDDFACTEDVCTAGACRHTPRDTRCATGQACLPAVCDPSGRRVTRLRPTWRRLRPRSSGSPAFSPAGAMHRRQPCGP